MKLKDKVALVTASTRGIGYAIVERLAEEGATVYMAARNMDLANEKAKALNEKGYKVKTVFNEAYNYDSYKNMVEEVAGNEGRIDILVNNFGTSNPSKDKTISETAFQDYIDTVNVNLASVFITSQAVIPYMRKNGGGSIINISSLASIVPDMSQVAYGTSKAAINHLTKMIAVQEARNNIRCNAVLPGMTATDAVNDNLTDDFRDFFLKHTPIRRMATPEEIAGAVAYFASDESSFATGQTLALTGGFGLATPIFGDMAGMANLR